MKVAGTNTPPDDIPICAAGNIFHLLEFHDIHDLLTNFPGSTHRFWMKEVLLTPVVAVSTVSGAEVDYIPMSLPLIVYVKEGEMVAFGHKEFLSRGIAFFHPFWRSIEYCGNR